jgi:hypothetical protein
LLGVSRVIVVEQAVVNASLIARRMNATFRANNDMRNPFACITWSE